jgi:hypothetical protein
MFNGKGLTPFTQLSGQRQNENASFENMHTSLGFYPEFLTDTYGLLNAIVSSSSVKVNYNTVPGQQ